MYLNRNNDTFILILQTIYGIPYPGTKKSKVLLCQLRLLTDPYFWYHESGCL